MLPDFGLFPPREFELQPGELNLPAGLALEKASKSRWRISPGSPIKDRRRAHHGAPAVLRVEFDGRLPAEGYSLQVTPEEVCIGAADENGCRYAMQTLENLLAAAPRALRCFRARDWPALGVRGMMLDISRCKVPRLGTLRARIRRLARLRFNQLQLYTEHTFAFPGHRLVWQDASPLRPKDYRTLDRECREHGIELVPNFNCFGHLERWLRHPPYRHLAEHPGPFTNQFGTRYPNGTTLKPNEESAEFIDGLLANFLPSFHSAQLNIGCDETWELGKGWSAPLVAEKGLGAVYLEHLKRLHAKVRARGKTPQFWADIVFEHPELIPEVPRPSHPVIWGYEANHPFAEQCRQMQETGLSYLVAPGTSSWLSLTSRWSNARANIENAISSATAFGASGVLLTDWGDRGHHQCWIVSWPAVLAAAANAWTGSMPTESELAHAMPCVLGWPQSSVWPETLLRLGKLDRFFTRALPNRSPLYEMLSADRIALDELQRTLPQCELEAAWKEFTTIREAFESGSPAHRQEHAELVLTMMLVELALRRGLGRDRRYPHEELQRTFSRIWLRGNRTGGLKESLRLLMTNPLA